MALEDAARLAARHTHTRLVILRLGHVLSSQGGLFPHLERASLCRAGRLGSGQQWVPWVHIADAAAAVRFACADGLLQHDDAQTASAITVNVAAPEPATNETLLATLAHLRQRAGCVVPVPQLVLSHVVGESSSVILDSQHVVPSRLVEAGFVFRFPGLSAALASEACL